ncbi:hypothetical protein AAHE18_12G129700 [Arachis hypogaea]
MHYFKEMCVIFLVAGLLKGTAFSHAIMLQMQYCCTNWAEICDKLISSSQELYSAFTLSDFSILISHEQHPL